jgi:prefoldin subunit 5
MSEAEVKQLRRELESLDRSIAEERQIIRDLETVIAAARRNRAV